MDPIIVSLSFNKLVVDAAGPDGPVLMEVREMNASSRDTYMQALSSRMEMDKEGKAVSVKNYQGLQSDLLSRCLFRGNDLVTQEEIQTWPATAVQTLFDAAQKLNHLEKDEQTEQTIKND